MPKKIEDYLREGLPSKIYFYAFPKAISRYKIADILYGKPVTSHISVASRNMINNGYLTETPEGILSNVKPLLDEIKKDLDGQNIVLTKSEKNELFNFLDTTFRHTIQQYMVTEKETPYTKGDMNAYHDLTALLGYTVFAKSMSNLIPKHDCLPIPANTFMEAMINNLPKDSANETRKSKKIIEEEIQLSNGLLKKLKPFTPEPLNPFLSFFEEITKNNDKKKG